MFDNPYMIAMWAFVYLLGCYITYFGFKYAEEQLEPHFKVYINTRFVLSVLLWPLTLLVLLLALLPCYFIDKYFRNRKND